MQVFNFCILHSGLDLTYGSGCHVPGSIVDFFSIAVIFVQDFESIFPVVGFAQFNPIFGSAIDI